jgi:hypothetical protein
VSVTVRVDLGSAVVSYRPAAGEERSSLARKVSSECCSAIPWRTFRWYFGQCHYSGPTGSATERALVGYESRLELAGLILADFDRDVKRIASQPFNLTFRKSGRSFRRMPDYLFMTETGSWMSSGPRSCALRRSSNYSNSRVWSSSPADVTTKSPVSPMKSVCQHPLPARSAAAASAVTSPTARRVLRSSRVDDHARCTAVAARLIATTSC